MKKLLFSLLLILFLGSNATAQFYKIDKAKMDLGGNLGTNLLLGETSFSSSKPSPNLGFYSLYQYSDKLAFKLQLGYGQLQTKLFGFNIKTSMIPVELIGMYSIPNIKSLSPFVHVGLGFMNYSINSSPRYFDGLFIGGAGFNMPISPKLSFLLTADLRYTTGDVFNGVIGGMNDGYFSLQAGLSYHLSSPQTTHEKKPIIQKNETLANRPRSKSSSSTQSQTAKNDDVYLELIQLRSKIEKLQDDVDKKNAQIEELKTLIKIKNDKINLLDSQVAGVSDRTGSSQTSQGFSQYGAQRSSRSSANVQGALPETNQRTSVVKQKYDNALMNFNAHNYRAAIMELTELSNENSTHKLASNFYYWIGESYYGLKNYTAAIEAFQNIAKYSDSPKADDALLMAGICHLKLGDNSKANEKFSELLQKYPNSEYANKARNYLKTIKTQLTS